MTGDPSGSTTSCRLGGTSEWEGQCCFFWPNGEPTNRNLNAKRKGSSPKWLAFWMQSRWKVGPDLDAWWLFGSFRRVSKMEVGKLRGYEREGGLGTGYEFA